MSLLAKWLAKNAQKLGIAGEPLVKEYAAAIRQSDDVGRRLHMAAQSSHNGYAPESYERWFHQPDGKNAQARELAAKSGLLDAIGLSGDDVFELKSAINADLPDRRPIQARLKPVVDENSLESLFYDPGSLNAYGETRRRR